VDVTASSSDDGDGDDGDGDDGDDGDDSTTMANCWRRTRSFGGM